MSILPSKVAEHGYTAMLERWARECPNNQFIREFTKNAIQAIPEERTAAIKVELSEEAHHIFIKVKARY